jgi:hypothetical protein
MSVDPMQAKAIFLGALEKVSPERDTYLDALCAADAALPHRIEAMLAAHAASGGLLPQAPADMVAAQGTGTPATALFGAAPAGNGAPGDQVLAFLAPPTQPATLGRLGHFHVQEVIGRGGFGIVLKAFDEKLHRVVAIKVLAPELAVSGVARQRFVREARAAAAINHEHVVAIHAIDEEHRPPYLVMQFVDGITLQDALNARGALALREILRIGSQIARGLAAAHKHGIVHRDIKPANILLENGVERVKITDFGLARAVDDAGLSQSGTIAGTPLYMSPEQANGEAVDHRSDLFSLGSLLYVMATGAPPFRASGTQAVLRRVIDASPRPIRASNPDLPDWLGTIIARLHAKKPEDRFASAREVAELLEQRLARVQSGQASSAHLLASGPVPSSAVAGLPAQPRRRRRWGIVLPILAGIFVLAIGVAWRFWPVDPPGSVVLLWDDPQLRVNVHKSSPGQPSTVIAGERPVYVSSGAEAGASFMAPPGVYRLTALKGGIQVWTTPFAVNPGDEHTVVIPETGIVSFPNVGDDYELQVNGKALPAPWYDPNGVRVSTQPKGEVSWCATKDGKTVASGSVSMRGGQSITVPVNLPNVVEPGWVRLFNGKNFDGWITPEPGPDVPEWKVSQKLSTLTGGGGTKPGYLISEPSDFADFHLRAWVSMGPKTDGGIFFRCDNPPFRGKYPRGLRRAHRTGALSQNRLAAGRRGGGRRQDRDPVQGIRRRCSPDHVSAGTSPGSGWNVDHHLSPSLFPAGADRKAQSFHRESQQQDRDRLPGYERYARLRQGPDRAHDPQRGLG